MKTIWIIGLLAMKIREFCCTTHATPHEIKVYVVFEFVQVIHKLNIRAGYPGHTIWNILGVTRDRT
jgi:hypothetical protein